MGCCNATAAARTEKEFANATRANSQLLDTINFLNATPMFSGLRPQDYPKVAAACTRRACALGEEMVVAGDTSAEFFVIRSGVASMWSALPVGGVQRSRSAVNSPEQCTTPTRRRMGDAPSRGVSKESAARDGRPSPKNAAIAPEDPQVISVDIPDDEVVNVHGFLKLPSTGFLLSMPSVKDGFMKVATLKSKDYFGERALIWGEAIDVTVVAESEELECIVISQEQYRELGLLDKLRLPKRKPLALPSSAKRGKSSQRVVKKTEEEAALIVAALQTSDPFNEILGLTGSDAMLLRAIADRAARNELNDGEVLIDPTAQPEQCLYIVDQGALLVDTLQDSAKADLECSSPMAKRRLITLHSDSMLSMEKESTVGRGSCYGELALLSEAPYDAVVRAVGGTVVWKIAPADFAESMRFVAERKADQNAELLDNVEIFSTLLSDEKWIIGRALREVKLECGRQLTEQGKVADTFCILVEGEVSVVKDGVETERLTAGEDNVEYFGQEALAQPAEMSPSTVTVTSRTAQCFTLNPEAMTAPSLGMTSDAKKLLNNAGRYQWNPGISCLSGCLFSSSQWYRLGALCCNVCARPPAPRRRARAGVSSTGTTGTAVSWGLASSVCSSTSSVDQEAEEAMALSFELEGALTNLRVGKEETKAKKVKEKAKKTDLRLQNIKRLGTLGKGAFGLVELSEHVATKELFALKKMKKAKVSASEVLKAQVMNEKRILQMTDSPFITKLHKTYRTESELMLLLEPALGGELYTIYFFENFFGKQPHTQFYVASLVCALTHLHERYIIYRDLKPENVLLDAIGRLKLADMGLAKFVVGKTYTVCGTPVYLAPEAARQSGYTVAVDWWSLGILTWELLTAKTPFEAQSRGEVMHWLFTRKILAHLTDDDYEWPPGFDEPTKDFMCALLAYEPSQRVPMQPDGAQLLRANSWFSGLDWEALERGTSPPPYSPPKLNRNNLSTLKNFRTDVTADTDDDDFQEADPGWDQQF